MDISLFTRIRIALIPGAIRRTQFIIKHKLFAEVGDNFFFQPRKMPINGEYIKIHNNVSIASNVSFINHDVMQKVFNNIDPNKQCKKKYGCIEIMDNVFIGSNATVLYDVRIGPNAIVAAGSVVTKDVPEGVVVAGVPAKVIGSFSDLYNRRYYETKQLAGKDYSSDECWKRFYDQRKKSAPYET